MSKKYLSLIWILILNSSNQFVFSRNYIENKIFKESKNINKEESLTFEENSNSLIKSLNKHLDILQKILRT